MKMWVTVRGDEELYVHISPSDPGDWNLAYPSPEDAVLCASLTEAEHAAIEQQVLAALNDPSRWDDQP